MEREYTVEELIENIMIFAEGGTYTKREAIELCLTAVEVLGSWECFSCGVDTFALGEDFYVEDDLWRQYGVEGMLCIGCFEKRLGREMVRADFKGVGGPDKWEEFFPHAKASERYRDRWGRE